MADYVKKSILPNGIEIPMIGLGLGAWQSADDTETLEEAVEIALNVGYRHFDTTPPNDKAIGTVLKKWLDQGKIKREELFVVSKLPLTAMWPYRVNEYLRDSLKSLELDFVDLYLIQFPVGIQMAADEQKNSTLPESADVILENTNLESIWKAMENEIKVGRTKAIGICDFNREQIERLLKTCTIKPAVLQMEVNIYFQRHEMREFCRQKGIAVCAYAPLGLIDITDLDLDTEDQQKLIHSTKEPVVKNLARKYGKTPSQIVLSFLIDSNIIVVPKCLNQFDIKSNIKVCSFKLEEGDFKALKSLDKGLDEAGHIGRTVFSEMFTGVEKHPEYPWNK